MGRWPFWLFLSTDETFPAFLEHKCLILSGLVVPDEKGMAFHCRIQEESLILGLVMKMDQTSCPDAARPAHTVPSKVEFQNEEQGLETWPRG